ncbi:MAG: hypothetical protein P8L45_07280 [Longimicrobiales bacterium]|nr:hypothetical protein [Longimicrobiales bacterium]
MRIPAINEAADTLQRIGMGFIEQATRVGEALGAIERHRLKELAGEAPLEQIEALADQIIQTSTEEGETLEALTREVHRLR